MSSSDNPASLFLFAFTAFFSIINPLGGTFFFLSATRSFSDTARTLLARWVAIYSFIILCVSLYIGAYVLSFFGISLPALRVAGGIVIAMTAWQMLNRTEDAEPQREQASAELHDHTNLRRQAFYPLTMPITTGPGTISVAVSLGTRRPQVLGSPEVASFFVQTMIAAILMCILIYVLYRHSQRISQVMGSTGTAIVMRLSAFLLFCIGIEVLWAGASEMLRSLNQPA